MVKRHIIILISVLVSAAGMISCADRVVIRKLDDVETYKGIILTAVTSAPNSVLGNMIPTVASTSERFFQK